MSSAIPTSGGPKSGDIIPDSYIVVLKEDTSESDFKAHCDKISSICSASAGSNASSKPYDHLFDLGSLKGYCGTFSKAIIDEISTHADVAYVEQNKVVTIHEDENLTSADVVYSENDTTWTTEEYTPLTGVEASEAESYEEESYEEESEVTAARLSKFLRVQKHIPTWGLGAISHRSGRGDSFVYHASAGEGVEVFVLSTGIRTTHQEFEGRARWGANFVPGTKDADTSGNGTHVAGNIAGRTFGAAKRAKVVGVKILGDSGHGNVAHCIAGIQWSVKNARRGNALINIPLDSPFSQAINDAVNSAFDRGVLCIVRAGSRNIDASAHSPAAAAKAFTVGATMQDGKRWNFSTYGPALSMFAPGYFVHSAGNESDTQIRGWHGGGQSSAFATGVAACFMVLYRLRTPAAIRQFLIRSGTRNILTEIGPGSPNIFLYNLSGR